MGSWWFRVGSGSAGSLRQAPFLLQTLGSSDATSCASKEPQVFVFLFLFLILLKRNAPRPARSSAVPWPYGACPQPLPSWWLSLPKASGCLSGSFLRGWSRSLVLPWKFGRLILFSAASRAPRVPETDGDRPTRGLFLAGERKESSGPGAGSRRPRARCPGRGRSGCHRHRGTLGWKQQAMFSTHTHVPAWFRHPPSFNAHGPPCIGALGALQAPCRGLQPSWDPPAASLVPESWENPKARGARAPSP